MKENFASINIILDKSGSMYHLADDTVGGYNQFIKEQRDLPGEALVTLVTFNSSQYTIYECEPINKVPELNTSVYTTNGTTALLDAIGVTIDNVGTKLASLPEEDRPSKVLFLIITDGMENSSSKYNHKQIKEMIKHQEEKYSWVFTFYGANIDSYKEGNTMGIARNNTMNYEATSIGTKNLYTNISKSVSKYRTDNIYNIDPDKDPNE